MDTIATGLDARGYLAGWLMGQKDMYVKDLKAIPADKLTVSPGGVARPVNELTADAIGLGKWCANALRGNVDANYGEDAMANLAASLTTHEALIAAVSESMDDLAAAIADASDETFNAIITPPWQMPAPLYVLTLIAVNHFWYHDAQLNYFQALNGDGAVHWMD